MAAEPGFLGISATAWTAIAAIGQVVGALGAAGAALFAYRTILASREINQTQLVASLQQRYAGSEMYAHIRDFGRFISTPDRQLQLQATIAWLDGRGHDEAEAGQDRIPRDVLALIKALEDDKDAMAGRRAIHHYFKTLHGFAGRGALRDHDLVALTTAHAA